MSTIRIPRAATPTELERCSEMHVDRVLSYVVPDERRVLSACGSPHAVSALLDFRAPRYTSKPVQYLSSSELSISVAQVCHLLVDLAVADEGFKYKDVLTPAQLAVARREHRLYFMDFRMKFHRKREATPYSLDLLLRGIRRSGTLLVAKFSFVVEDAVEGHIIAGVEI